MDIVIAVIGWMKMSTGTTCHEKTNAHMMSKMCCDPLVPSMEEITSTVIAAATLKMATTQEMNPP
jgi:hypothetical protein